MTLQWECHITDNGIHPLSFLLYRYSLSTIFNECFEVRIITVKH